MQSPEFTDKHIIFTLVILKERMASLGNITEKEARLWASWWLRNGFSNVYQ